MDSRFLTPFEMGNGNQTTHWHACISYYQQLAAEFPDALSFFEIGTSDAGRPIHAGIITADGVHDFEQIKEEGRPIFFNNNGIHPGEPEGVDACMALVRDFCLNPERRLALGRVVFLFIPLYNVDGSLNRNNSSRVNQEGPEQFGFRGNALHLDLNRDFIKCDSLNAAVFNRFFAAWSPDVMVDTHTSNGADYQYTMTLIQTQADKLGGATGDFLRTEFLPQIFAQMEQRGWPTCPYVNPVKDIPDHGIEDFLETPRFSTGFTSLHHCIGFMPETHMLKPYADRYASMRQLVESVLHLTIQHAERIQAVRAADRQAIRARSRQGDLQAVRWTIDYDRPSQFQFKGYEAEYKPSVLGQYQRLSYRRDQPFDKPIPYFNRCKAQVEVRVPKAYVIPQAWRHVIERLHWNGVKLQMLAADQVFDAEVYRVQALKSRPNAYEGHLFHDEVELSSQIESVQVFAGDFLVSCDQDAVRYVLETLEPQAHDSFFRWGFFNSVLEKKEAYSDYVFEDTASELLQSEPELAHAFAEWKLAHPDLLSDQSAILDFLFQQCQRYREPEWRRYPVLRLMS